MQCERVEIGSKWQHFKGDVVKVVNIVKNSETLEEMVVYEHKDVLWARPVSSFLSSDDVSTRCDNVTGQKYRFERKED